MEMNNGFVFDQISTGNFHMYVEKYPAIKIPKRRLRKIHIPGRNGDLHIEEDSYENYMQPYKCYFHDRRPAPEHAHTIAAWLSAHIGYHRLEDVYDKTHFRMAAFYGPADIENELNEFGETTILFDCKPQSFLKAGENTIEYSKPGTLVNPTLFKALPMITVHGTGAGRVTIGGFFVEIRKITQDKPIILNCETMDAYSQPGEGAPEPQNQNIKAYPFPLLRPGENPISFSGGITKIEIIPRWWEL